MNFLYTFTIISHDTEYSLYSDYIKRLKPQSPGFQSSTFFINPGRHSQIIQISVLISVYSLPKLSATFLHVSFPLYVLTAE